MVSIVYISLLFFIFTSNSLGRADALLRKYVSLISDVHHYYGTSSVFFLFPHKEQNLQKYTLANTLCQNLSRKGILTLIVHFNSLISRTNFYHRKIVRPLITVMLESVNEITEFNKHARNVNTGYPVWLVIFVDQRSKTLCEYCDHPVQNFLRLQLTTEMLVMCCDSPVLKEWWSIHPNTTETIDFATWTEDRGFNLLEIEGLLSRRSKVDGAGLRVAIVTSSDLIHDYGDTIGGFYGTVLQELQSAMNFSVIKTIRETGFGSWNSETDSWSGVVGQVAERKADLGVAEFTITNSRRNVVDFTLPLLISRFRLYMRNPDGSGVQWFSYIEVFKFEIWMTLLVLLITTPVLLTVIQVKRTTIPLMCLVIENYLHVWGIFCQEAPYRFPAETPLRIAYVSIFVSAVVVSAAYSASLISFLTVSSVSLPFSTFAGFADDESYKLIVFPNTSDYDLFKTAGDPVLEKMMTLMKPWNDLPQTLEEGFEQVCKERVAFFTDNIVKTTLSNRINCKLAEIASGHENNIAMILSPESQYTRIINYHIQRFKANGMLSRLNRIYFDDGNSVETINITVDIWDIVPILTVLAVGIVLATMVLFCEKISICKKLNPQKWQSE